MTGARIIFVPGLKPKPAPEVYAPQLRRVLFAALERSRPAAAHLLEADPALFQVASWTYLLYGVHRDIALDLPGIERLLARAPPSEADRRAVSSWLWRAVRLSHAIGDAVPILGRWFARPSIRAQMHDANRYLRNRDGVGTAIRERVRAALADAWAARARVLLIGHSLGSVIAYDTLWELSREGSPGRVDLFVSMGSPLGSHFIRRRLRGTNDVGAAKYPANIGRWINLAAKGDTTALQPRLAPAFGEMVELGLLESIEDFVDLENFFHADYGLNVHEAYGYMDQPKLAEIVGGWLEETARGAGRDAASRR